ncbi:sensor histidine kinase [Cognatilysobacter bugurensis]|nr:histidine kinase [Lysobacter bugurensis]
MIAAAVVAWWGLNAVVWACQVLTMRANLGQPAATGHVLRTEFASAALWIPATFALLWCVSRVPIERGRWKRAVPVLLAASLAVVVYRAVVVVALNGWIGWYDAVPGWQQVLLTSVLNNLVMCWLIVGVGHALVYAERSRIRDLQAEVLQTRLMQARLDALSAQLNPHFLFNALNSIAEMVHHDADAADRMIVELGALLRHSLESSRRQHTSLRDELDALQCYIGIEQVRLGDRLRFRCDVEPGALEAQVPRLMLQPLVENAVSHAVAQRASPGTVEVHAVRDAARLVLEVRDDGGDRPSAGGFGVGLANTRARLQCLYADDHRLDIDTRGGHGTRVRIDLPLVIAAAL